jgi:PPM family protein phosphatase
MTDSPSRSQPTLAERLYQILLLAYPRAFRQEYGYEMLLVFRDAYHEATKWRGTIGVLCLWRDYFTDLVKTVCIQWVSSWMNRDTYDCALLGKEQLAMAMQFRLNVAQRTDTGRTRANNQDQLVVVVPEDQQLLEDKGALFVVADGLGGHNRGEVASALTVQQVKETYYKDNNNDIPVALQDAIKQANTTVYQANQKEQSGDADTFGMGATCVAAVLHDQMLYAANVGDSRIYVLREGNLRQITRDHSVVAQLVEQGEITAAEARTHEKRNQIYRALGAAEVEVDVFSEPTQEGDTIVLCTDGLWDVLEEKELSSIISQYSPDESVQHLIARVNESGGPDNVTAIVVHLSGDVRAASDLA